MSEDCSKGPEPEVTTPSDVRQALKELASAVAKHDVESSPEVDKALEGLASAVAGREPTEDDRRALVEFASDIGFAVPEEEQEAQGATTQNKTVDCQSLLKKVTALLEQAAETVASRQSGQELIRHADSFLKVFELTALWEQEANYERPMPWMMLIPLLVLMKVLRCGLAMAAPCVGYNSPSLRDMIRFIRRQRRSLRALKYSGMKNIRHMRRNLPESEQQSMDPNLFERLCVLLPLRILADLSGFVGLKTLPRPDKQMKRKLDDMLKDEDEGTSAQPRTSEDDRRKEPEGQEQEDEDDDDDDLNLTLTEQLDMYADIPSEEDPDYEPPEGQDKSSDSCGEEPEGTAPPSELSPVPVIVIDEAESEDQEGEEGSAGEDSVTTVVHALEDSDSRERAAMSSGRHSPADDSLVSNPDPVALSYGTPMASSSSSVESGGSASRSLLSKFLGSRRHKTPAL